MNRYQKDIKEYKNKLEDKNLPVIYSLPHLCLLAGVNITRIINFCESERTHNYSRFKILKKRGGFRVIHSPIRDIKYLQRWILKNILLKIDSHQSSNGFDPKDSIKKNALKHTGKDALLKMDLQRFFDSINEKRIYGIFYSMGYHPNLSVSLAKICTILPDSEFKSSFKKDETKLKNKILNSEEGFLPQGAPTSPKLANLVSRKLDNRLNGLASKNKVDYTRYADDLTFSGEEKTLRKIKSVINHIILDENFFVNHKKSRIYKRGMPLLVTGVSVHNNKVTVPKKKKKEIEFHLYHCVENGVINHMKKNNIRNRNYKDWLLGNISFIYSIEPDVGKSFFEEFNKIQWPI